MEPLAPGYDRASFSCGEPALDIYLQRQARQDSERNLAAVSVLTRDGTTIAGFYTLSACSVASENLPAEIAKKLPRLPVPAILLGRMAVSLPLHGQGFGELLLLHALRKAHSRVKDIAFWAMLVDAKAGAREFYKKYGFEPFSVQTDRLFLPMSTLENFVASELL